MTKTEAIVQLRRFLHPGSQVYTIRRSCSSSGMTRRIDLYAVHRGGMVYLTYCVAKALGYKYDSERDGIRVNGHGMDMGSHVVYSLGRILFPKGFIPARAGRLGRNGAPNTKRDTDGGYALFHSWL